jgi:hypothetical protein
MALAWGERGYGFQGTKWFWSGVREGMDSRVQNGAGLM